MFTCIHSTKTYIPGRVVSSFLLRLRLIKASLAKFRWPLGEAPSALGTFFGRRGGINNLFDCVCGKLLSAQPPAGLAAGPHWRLDREAKLDQAADSCGASKARLPLPKDAAPTSSESTSDLSPAGRGFFFLYGKLTSPYRSRFR